MTQSQLRQSRSKVEVLGLGAEAMKLRGEGLGSIRIARALSKVAKTVVNATNIDNYFKSINKRIDMNKDLSLKVDNAVRFTKTKILTRFDKWDDELNSLLKEVKEPIKKMIGVDKKTGEPIIFSEKDRSLLLAVINTLPKLAESKAKLLGQLQQGSTKIFVQHIEHQYNDLKTLIVKAEDKFPGINEWLEEQQYIGKRSSDTGFKDKDSDDG